MTPDPAPDRGLPTWLVYFVFVVQVGVMFWCIALMQDGDVSPLLRAVFILNVAGLIALPHAPRRKD